MQEFRLTTTRTGPALTLAVAGRFDITTVPHLEAALPANGVTHLTLDLRDCHYISSAGLRWVLRAHQQMTAAQGALALTHVTPEVYSILEVTGLTKLLAVRKKAREISLEGLELISAGVCGECYRVDRESVVKLYRDGIEPEIAEREKEYARAAFVLGIPTAISYDVVTCGTRTGIIYEMLDAELFSKVIRNDPAGLDRHAQTLATITRTVHATRGDRAVFPDMKQRFQGYLRQMDFFLPPDDIRLLLAKLATIPDADNCVHFDLHTSNIMIRQGEPVIIDMGDVSIGSYLFDIGLLNTIYGLPELGISELATKIPTAQGVQLWEAFLKHYFADKPAAEYEFFDRNRYFLGSLRAIYSITFLPQLRDALCRMVTDTLMPRIREER
ncbi:MAG: hypothetical protein RJA22_2932 [Verrucomicrobiota bacterium]|jgi:uncharacterized protein (TIGR02172 family)